MPLRLSVVSRCRLEPGLRAYAEEKLGRLERHSPALHQARLTLEGDGHRDPAFSAEVVAHVGHAQVTARVDAATQRVAIDRVIDRVDRRLLRRKDRVTEHKGHPHAGTDPADPRPRRITPASA
jgi:ribosomal subunit interface protein